MEKLNQSLEEQIKKTVFRKAGVTIAERAKNSFEENDFSKLHKVMDDYFQDLNIDVEYTQSHDPNFEEMRTKLNTEPGVIISNHPGKVDSAAIIKTIHRNDIKIIVTKNGFDTYLHKFGEQYFIPAKDENGASLSALREAETHIKKGGVILIFPSGRQDTGEVEFKDGLTFLIQRMDPQNMVYSFHINEEDVTDATSNEKLIGLSSATFISPNININKLGKKGKLRVDEKYSSAKEWQEIMDSLDRKTNTRKITEHYKEAFEI